MGYLRTSLDNTVCVGCLVSLETTSISIIDASNLHEFLRASLPHIPGTKQERRQTQKELKLVGTLLNVLNKMFPLGIQMRCRTESDEGLWAILTNDFLRQNPASLTLKYGSQLQGRWRVIGIVDAVPSDHQTRPSENAVHAVFSNLQDEMQKQLGRSPDEYGLLPLVIFRDLQKPLHNGGSPPAGSGEPGD